MVISLLTLDSGNKVCHTVTNYLVHTGYLIIIVVEQFNSMKYVTSARNNVKFPIKQKRFQQIEDEIFAV